MKVLVTGVKGQLGFDVVNELTKRGHGAVGVDVSDMDVTDAESVNRVMQKVKPDAVIHCAAWTAVDAAEDNEDKVRLVNAVDTENIVKECKALDCKLIYISTDYVFDGKGEKAWLPDCKDYSPLNVYGKTKLEGELAVSLGGNIAMIAVGAVALAGGIAWLALDKKKMEKGENGGVKNFFIFAACGIGVFALLWILSLFGVA